MESSHVVNELLELESVQSLDNAQILSINQHKDWIESGFFSMNTVRLVYFGTGVKTRPEVD